MHLNLKKAQMHSSLYKDSKSGSTLSFVRRSDGAAFMAAPFHHTGINGRISREGYSAVWKIF